MRRRLAKALCFALLLIPLLPPAAAHAAEYEMATVAGYRVDPDAGQIAVSVEVTFTNTLPDPPGQISAFDRIELAIQDGASQVAAEDDGGPLHVDLETRDGVQVASVKPRARVRYNRTASFTLSYRLIDGATPELRVRSRVVKFAAWGFGTSSQVTVQLPSGYEVHADGDPMLSSVLESGLVLTSGPIPNPDQWLALITAVRPSEYLTQSASVALASGTVDLQVRSWSDDEAWGADTLSLLVAALPMLEDAIGLPYPRVGPLVVSEGAGGETSTNALPSPTAEIQVAFDATPFTVLHQAAHIWISDQLAAERWIREGLASHYAARVAAQLGVEPPYDPAVRTSDLAADARPLVEWGAGASGSAADAYGYAASWAFADRIATTVGEAKLAMVLKRIAAGVSAYDPSEPVVPGIGLRFSPVDTRRLLDQLAAVSDADLAEPFMEIALGADAGPELAQRDAALSGYRGLLAKAGDWGAPDPVRVSMSEWRFDEAGAAIAQASAWLVARDALIVKVTAGGLVTPDRLRDRYALAGGGPDASAELDAERALVDGYLATQARTLKPRGPLDAIGLVGADDPKELLAEAATSFGKGDLRSAAGFLDQLDFVLNRASSDGVVRLITAVVLVALVGLGVGVALRRRAGSHYTAAP